MNFRSGGFRSGGGPAQIGVRRFMSGVYYAPSPGAADAVSALTQNTEYAVRFLVGVTTVFDRIGLEVTTGAASNVVRLGIRADTGQNYPGTLLLDAGTIDASAPGFLEKTISQEITPGQWWVSATLQGGTGAAVRHRALDPFIGQSLTSTSNSVSWTQTGVSGALSTFSATPASGAIGPKILLRAV